MNAVTATRLAFIKYLWRQGSQLARQPSPLSAAAVLTFHDAVELFLELSSEHLNAGAKQPNFMEYWDILSPKLPSSLGVKESMRRLNRARGALKHQGIFPSGLDIQGFEGSVQTFFAENTPLVFGISIDEVSLVTLVSAEAVRRWLQQAEQAVTSNDLAGAVDAAAVAFSLLRADSSATITSPWGSSPFDLHKDLARYKHAGGSMFRTIDDSDGDLRGFVDGVTKAFDQVYVALELIALGVDYYQYLRFRQATPYVTRTLDGSIHITRVPTAATPELSLPVARFCIDFVVETALSFAERNHVHGLFSTTGEADATVDDSASA